jgi:molybdopterin/thiamine biosynthesis adenylyltransferase
MKRDVVLTSRFSSADWFGQDRIITIGGAGTIGSWLSLLLSRTGDHTFIMYDDDVVDTVNIAGQLFSMESIGKNKVECLAQNMISFSDTPSSMIFAEVEKIEKESEVSDVCFSCFDNMKARRMMFDLWKMRETREIFIDGRMTMESYQVYTVTPENEDEYEKTLFSDEDVAEQICSLKSTSHIGALIGARMTSTFMNHLANISLGMPMRNIPFLIREDLEPMTYEQC